MRNRAIFFKRKTKLVLPIYLSGSGIFPRFVKTNPVSIVYPTRLEIDSESSPDLRDQSITRKDPLAVYLRFNGQDEEVIPHYLRDTCLTCSEPLDTRPRFRLHLSVVE